MDVAFDELNYLAVAAAIVANMLVGALWYSLLFGKAWMAINNITEEDIRRRGSATRGYIVSFIASVVIAFTVALLANATGVADALEGAVLGLIVSVGLTAMAFASSYVFEDKSLKHYLINAGYPVVSVTALGAIIGAAG